MHFTVHSDPKCLGVYAEGYGSTCSSEGFRLPLLLSLYFVLHSNCGVNALFVCLCVTCINSNLNKRGGQNKFPGFSFIYIYIRICGSVYLGGWNYQAGWEWVEWSLTTALGEPTRSKSTLMGFQLVWVWPGVTWHPNPPSWIQKWSTMWLNSYPSGLSLSIAFIPFLSYSMGVIMCGRSFHLNAPPLLILIDLNESPRDKFSLVFRLTFCHRIHTSTTPEGKGQHQIKLTWFVAKRPTCFSHYRLDGWMDILTKSVFLICSCLENLNSVNQSW